MKKLLLVLALLSPMANADIGKHCDIVIGMYKEFKSLKATGFSDAAFKAMVKDQSLPEKNKEMILALFDVIDDIDESKVVNACYENYTVIGDITKFLEADIYKTVKVN